MLPINPTAETYFLCGKSVYLRPFEKKDLPYLYQWGNDPDIRSLTAEVTPMTPSGLEKFWEKVSNEPDRVWFTVCLKDGDRPIGEAGLLRMFPAWRTTDRQTGSAGGVVFTGPTGVTHSSDLKESLYFYFPWCSCKANI
jgi:RimJ/RimL family protein N-acetyltransferase